MTIQLTLPTGETQRIEVQDFSIVQQCHHCEAEFLTRDPRKQYVNPNHRKLAENVRYKVRTALDN